MAEVSIEGEGIKKLGSQVTERILFLDIEIVLNYSRRGWGWPRSYKTSSNNGDQTLADDCSNKSSGWYKWWLQHSKLGERRENGLKGTMKSKDTCPTSEPNGMTQFGRENSYHFRKLEAEVISSAEVHVSARTRKWRECLKKKGRSSLPLTQWKEFRGHSGNVSETGRE